MNETKWLTVKEASQYCLEMNLPRSTKTLRRWCAKEDIEAQKRQTGHGEKWFIDRESLEIKIKEELEFLKHSETPLPHPDQPVGQGSDMSGHERTGADVSGHGRSRPDVSAQDVDTPGQPNMRDLQDQVLLLKNDIQWRDQVLKDQKNANLILMDEVKGQSRYIGHLETNVLRLGGKTDQAFLAAPVPKSGMSEDMNEATGMPAPEVIQPERPHPDQSNLYTG